MASLPQYQKKMTESEYLKFEENSDIKHEYIDGEIFAMTGASRYHNTICVNVITSLRNQSKGSPCKIYPSDMRVKIESLSEYTYPDISLVCGDPQFAEGVFDSLINPILLIEVLSPSTEAYDRGKKFQIYRHMASLKEYILIAQDSPHIERYYINKAGNWELSDIIGLDNTLNLISVPYQFVMRDIYDLVIFKTDES